MEAAHKVAQAEERVRKREVRLAELEKSAKELKDKAAQRGGTAASGAAKLGNLLFDSDSDEEDESEKAAQKAEKAQERADEERHQVELAKRGMAQARQVAIIQRKIAKDEVLEHWEALRQGLHLTRQITAVEVQPYDARARERRKELAR